MKMKLFIIILTLFFINQQLFAQRDVVRSQIRSNIESDIRSTQKEKGIKPLQDIIYENDKRFEDYENPQPLVLEYVYNTFDKKGNVKKSHNDKFVFGKKEECIVNFVDEKSETRIIYNYAGKANYVVNLKDSSAVKMPLVNAQKMILRKLEKELEQIESWTKTDEIKTINDFVCRKYICKKNNGSYIEIWSTEKHEVSIPSTYLVGMQLQYIDIAFKDEENAPKGTAVEAFYYDKTGKLEMQRLLKNVILESEDKYFDVNGFKLHDVIDFLR